MHGAIAEEGWSTNNISSYIKLRVLGVFVSSW